MSVSSIKSPDLTKAPADRAETPRPGAINSEVLRGVRVSLDVCLGRTSLAVDDMMALKAGSVVTLETSLADTVELHLNGTLIARGEVVAVEDKYGIRIVEIAATP